MTPEPDPRWEPRSLSSTTLDRVLLDALSDLYADAFRREQPTAHQQLRFRDRLESLVTAATGTALCGLPSPVRQNLRSVSTENVPVPLAAVPSPHRSLDESGAHSGHAYGEQR